MDKMRNKDLALEILKMMEEDQKKRNLHIAGKSKFPYGIDRKNTRRLKEIIQEYGWPTISLVGRKASQGAWLLAQHADKNPKLQRKVLRILKQTHKRNSRDVALHDIAYLTDRILVHVEHRPQLFGTQFHKNKEDVFEPFPIRELREVNKRRKEYGLETLEKNTKRINTQWKKLGGK